MNTVKVQKQVQEYVLTSRLWLLLGVKEGEGRVIGLEKGLALFVRFYFLIKIKSALKK